MRELLELVKQHPTIVWGIAVSVFTWLFNNVATAAISSMPAPTKDSTPKYIFWFKFLNQLVGNYLRATHSHVELSPNWQDAIDKHLGKDTGNGPVNAPTA